MAFKDFWRKGSYINNVMVERSLLIISVYKEGSEA